MGRLDGFKMVRGHDDDQMEISLTKYGITFNHSSLSQLEYADYVHIFLNYKSREFAVQPCGRDINAVVLARDKKPGNQKKGRSELYRWSNRKLLRELVKMTGKSIDGNKIIHIRGKYYDDENVIIYDLKDAFLDESFTSWKMRKKVK